jgi:hypothetical protein
MDTEIIEGNGTFRPITNGIRYLQTVGINSVTMYDSNPYFFLFSDIDTKDTEILQRVLMVYKHRNLTAYYYETRKGWHVVSPVLLKLRKWAGLTEQLRKILPDYRFDTIRYTPRPTDGKILYLQQWNLKEPESYNLIWELHKKFMCDIQVMRECFVSTKLDWTIYNQLKCINIRHY